jgi:transposase
MDYFAQPRLRRDQLVLISTTLDDAVPQEHEVRLLDEILCGQDWSTWESHYGQRRGRGQPPIPPRVLASVILYGLIRRRQRRIRSSRVLEYLVGNNLDFMWLAEGRNIDHTTLCKFRTRFKQPLKELFRGLARLAMTMGLIRLGEITFDGTRAKANNGRSQIWTAAAVEKRLAELEAQFGQALDEAERTDAAEDEQFGLVSKPALPPELADAKARQQLLKEALKELKAADAARHRKGTDPTENPAQLPSTDLDSTVLPNKEGGYAPNYTPTAAGYYCPRATALDFEKTKPEIRQGQKITLRVYRGDCAGCPLAGKGVSEKSKGGRTITRDCYTPDRERHAAKMRTDDARTRYARRFHAGETPFGWLKHVLGLRQFLLRGLEKVRVEWLWACTGYNLNKLILAVRRLRAEFAALADGEIN